MNHAIFPMIVGLPKIHNTMKPMNTMRSAVLLGSVLSSLSLAHAGEVAPPPQTTYSEPSMWNWFIGGSGGVQGDDAEEFWSGHVGAEWKNDCNSHAIYLEVAFTDFSNNVTNDGPPFVVSDPGGPPVGVLTGDRMVVDVDVMPVTLNYKYEYSFTPSFGWYIGAGAGIAFVDSELHLFSSGGDKLADDDDEVFYAQIFTGVTWNVTENFEVFGGARYYFMDDVDFNVSDFEQSDSQDDWIVEAGLRFNF